MLVSHGGSLFPERNYVTVVKSYVFCISLTPVASSENRIFSKCFVQSQRDIGKKGQASWWGTG